MRPLIAATFGLALAACSSGQRLSGRADGSPSTASPRPASPEPSPSLSPARYVFTTDRGALFDDSSPSSTMSRAEPAIIDGTRVILDAGLVIASEKTPSRLSGFRSLPKRLGGGYVLWSDEATFRADDFLGDLKRILDVPASGGARPWLSGVLLRTERGVFEVNLSTGAARRIDASIAPGLADGAAIDERRAVRVDLVGRASFTIDGGSTFTDVVAARGFLTVGLREGDSGVGLIGPSGDGELRLPRAGAGLEEALDPTPPRARRSMSSLYFTPQSLELTFSKTLADESLAQAAVTGALLPGDRALVTRIGGLRLLSTRSARFFDDTETRGVAEWLSRCQPLYVPARRADPDVLLACSHARGAHVLLLDGDWSAPKLEASFVDVRGFIGGERGRLAFAGRCGQSPPSAADFSRNTAPRAPPEDPSASDPGSRPEGEGAEAQEPTAETPPSDDSPSLPPDDAHVCVRAERGRWLDRSVGGDDAKHLYRWIPGDDGAAVALVFAGDNEANEADKTDATTTAPGKKPRDKAKTEAKGSTKPEPPSPGVRVVRVDPSDPALLGGSFPAILPPLKDAPFRTIDPDFWIVDDGSIQGWLLLPSKDEEPSGPGLIDRDADQAEGRAGRDDAEARDKASRSPRLSDRLGGRVAGVRIGLDGHLTVYDLPPDTEHVVRGGRHALAMALKDDEPSFFETVDGGRTWTPVVGPPVGRIEPPSDATTPFACSSIGCALGSGVVRFGWGGPPPPATKEPPPPQTPNTSELSVKSTVLLCHLDSDTDPWSGPAPSKSPGAAKNPAGSASPSAAKGPAGSASPRGPTSPPQPGPLSIRTQASAALGLYRDGAWSADVTPPFLPSARPRSMSLHDAALGEVHGQIVPILTASSSPSSSPVDLLLLTDKRRIRLGSASPSLLPYEYGGRVAAFADAPGGALIGIDADRGFIVLAQGGPARPVMRIARVSDAAHTRLTLARSLDAKRADASVVIIGYSTSSGDVVIGDLDLGRAEIGPLRPLASLSSLVEASSPLCAAAASRASHRFVADIPVVVRLLSKSGRESFEGTVWATALLSASRDRVCAEGLEFHLPRGRDVELSVAFRPGGAGGGATGGASASVRVGAALTRLSCSLEPPSSPADAPAGSPVAP